MRPTTLVVQMNTVEKRQNPRQALAGRVLECVCVFKILQGTYCWDATWLSWNHLSEHSNWLGTVWWIGLLWLNWAWNHLNWSLKRQSPEPSRPWLFQFSSPLAYSQNRREKCIDFSKQFSTTFSIYLPKSTVHKDIANDQIKTQMWWLTASIIL